MIQKQQVTDTGKLSRGLQPGHTRTELHKIAEQLRSRVEVCCGYQAQRHQSSRRTGSPYPLPTLTQKQPPCRERTRARPGARPARPRPPHPRLRQPLPRHAAGAPPPTAAAGPPRGSRALLRITITCQLSHDASSKLNCNKQQTLRVGEAPSDRSGSGMPKLNLHADRRRHV